MEDIENNAVPSTAFENHNTDDIASEDKSTTIKSFNGEKDESTYPQGFRFCFILCAAALSIFLVSLDTTIVSTAIPRITDEFGSVDDIGWSALYCYMCKSSSNRP